MSKTMLINTIVNHECRIAILENGSLEELYIERASNASRVGNIFKGKVTNIEPSIQAAFVEYGGTKNGFLHITDLHPQYFPGDKKGAEEVGHRTSRKTRPPIQKCLRPGDQVIVQMTKEGIGTKGATLSTYLSLPGRLVVLMPDMKKTGISRKIEDPDARAKLRDIVDTLTIPENMGLIVRTACQERSKRDLNRDISYLSRLWKSIQQRVNSAPVPSEIYKESDLVIRTIRDIYESDINRIVCDNQDVAVNVREFIDIALPRTKCKIEVYSGRPGLFKQFGIERKIDEIHSSRVTLPGGGYLVIDQTEALVAIDVNSGSFRKSSNAESNAMKLNLEAVEEIGRQLRLRDMGGVIVIDLVDMISTKNRGTVEARLKEVLKKDRAKSKVLKINNFGLLNLTRQRLRPSLKQNIYADCPYCAGTGQVMSDESIALAVMRTLNAGCGAKDVASINVKVSPPTAHYISNYLRDQITDIERTYGKRIIITAEENRGGSDLEVDCISSRGTSIELDQVYHGGKNDRGEEFVNVNDMVPAKSSKRKRSRKSGSKSPSGTSGTGGHNRQKQDRQQKQNQQQQRQKQQKKEQNDNQQQQKERKSKRRRGSGRGRKKKQNKDGGSGKTKQDNSNGDSEKENRS